MHSERELLNVILFLKIVRLHECMWRRFVCLPSPPSPSLHLSEWVIETERSPPAWRRLRRPPPWRWPHIGWSPGWWCALLSPSAPWWVSPHERCSSSSSPHPAWPGWCWGRRWSWQGLGGGDGSLGRKEGKWKSVKTIRSLPFYAQFLSMMSVYLRLLPPASLWK